ncbi:MAG: T9SS type A sorting domain-containing protein [bacterium]|nr:T9SS type A sorting domain-containing protein [bacterium]
MNKLSGLSLMMLVAFATLLSLHSETQAIVHESWSNRYFSPAHGDEQICGIAGDESGNIYLGGQFQRDWSPNYSDWAILKITPLGSLDWIRFYDGGNSSDDIPRDFIRDNRGNFYLTGNVGMWSQDFATGKFDPDGNLLWVTQYSGPEQSNEYSFALAVDDAGFVYATGYTSTYPSADHIVTIKYTPDGAAQWIARFDSVGINETRACDVAVDHDGNVYVMGWQYQSGVYDGYDYLVIKYNAQGVQLWVNYYNGPGNGLDIPNALKLDVQANVYVTGKSRGTSATGYDIATIKYNSAGVQQWLRRYNTPRAGEDEARAMVIDNAGDIIIAGFMDSTGIDQQVFLTLKYNPDGVLQWDRSYHMGANYYGDKCPEDIIVDADRNIYIAGEITSSYYVSESVTMKYNELGELKWVARHITDGLAEQGGTWGKYLTLDQQNNVIVGGEFCFGGDILDHDWWVAKYQQTAGDLSATMIPTVSPIQIPVQGGRFSYSEQTVNPVVDNLRVDNWWKVIYPNQTTTRILGPMEDILSLGNQSTERSQRVPGYAPAGVYQYVMNVGEYPGVIWAADTLSFTKLGNGNGAGVDDWGILGSQGVQLNAPTQPVLLGVNPNPFNPTTVIRFTLPEAGRVSLDVFDTNGRVVGVQHVEPLQAGEHGITFDGSGLAAGVYVYRLTTENATVSGKMVLMK